MVIPPCTLTRTELLARLIACGLHLPDAVRILDLAEERRIIQWVGMSTDGDPVYRVVVAVDIREIRAI